MSIFLVTVLVDTDLGTSQSPQFFIINTHIHKIDARMCVNVCCDCPQETLVIRLLEEAHQILT